MVSAYQEAVRLVQDKFTESQNYARASLTLVYDLLNRLTNMASTLNVRDFHISIPEYPLDINVNEIIQREMPQKPDIVPNFPTPPQIVQLPSINFDDIVKPSMDDVQAPHIAVDPGSLTYDSQLLQVLKGKILQEIERGGTALSPEVEDAIWNRDYERELQAHIDGYRRVYSTIASRGFPIPSGTINALIEEHELNFTNKRIDRARDIAIKQEELAVENLRFFIERGINLEQLLITLHDSMAKRVLEASSANARALVDMYNAEIQKYNVMTSIYKALIEGKTEELRAVVETHRAQVEAFANSIRAESERINALTRVYTSEMEGFRTMVSAMESVAGLGIQIYKARIEEAIARANLHMKGVEVAIKNYESIHGMRIETIKAVATIASHIVAGMMAAVSASAGISATGSTQSQWSTSKQEIHYHYYEEG